MGCNCKWCEAVIAVVVFVLVMWPSLLGAMLSKWIIAVAAIVLFVHSMMCKNCMMCSNHKSGGMNKSPVVKKKRR